jgi:hypothetical protein
MSFVLVILVLSAKAPGDMIAFGVFESAKECWRVAAQIDASTRLILNLSCKAIV